MRRFSALAIFAALLSCSTPAKEGAKENSGDERAASSQQLIDSLSQAFDNDLTQFPNLSGVTGVYAVKPMLALCRMDSAAFDQLGAHIVNNYRVLDREAAKLGVNTIVAGQISYNNDPANFKFESLVLIDSIPGRKSDSAQAVMLEPGSMLLYNYYGPYDRLHTAYEKIARYCAASKLAVTAAMREFYISDPATQKDSSKWLTRIFVPVSPK